MGVSPLPVPVSCRRRTDGGWWEGGHRRYILGGVGRNILDEVSGVRGIPPTQPPFLPKAADRQVCGVVGDSGDSGACIPSSIGVLGDGHRLKPLSHAPHRVRAFRPIVFLPNGFRAILGLPRHLSAHSKAFPPAAKSTGFILRGLSRPTTRCKPPTRTT